jgi:hypothetical protein
MKDGKKVIGRCVRSFSSFILTSFAFRLARRRRLAVEGSGSRRIGYR